MTDNLKTSHKNTMELLFGDEIIDVNDPNVQLQGHLTKL